MFLIETKFLLCMDEILTNYRINAYFIVAILVKDV